MHKMTLIPSWYTEISQSTAICSIATAVYSKFTCRRKSIFVQIQALEIRPRAHKMSLICTITSILFS